MLRLQLRDNCRTAFIQQCQANPTFMHDFKKFEL